MNSRRNRRISLVVPIILACATLVPHRAAADALDRIKKAGVVRIANSGVYPPFEFKENDKLVGYDIDLSNLIARELGVTADISVVDFKGLIPALKSGKADMLVTAYTYTPERAQQVAFSDPYYATAIAIAVRNDNTQIQSKDQLNGTTIGAELGTTGDREAHSVKEAKDIKTYDTLMLALQDLEIGRLDAVISTLPPLQYLIHKNFRRTKVTATYDAGWMGVNVPIEEKALLAEVNRALKKLKDDGELATLNAKWFGEN